jgi:hypothetical protein
MDHVRTNMIIQSSIKQVLKKNKFIYSLNAYLKCRATKKQYNKILAHYATLKEPKPFDTLFRERLGERIERLQTLNRPLNIFFLGTDEMQDRSGTLQALEKFGQLTYFTREDGSYGHSYPSSSVNERCKVNSQRLWDLIQKKQAIGAKTDILIAQTRGSILEGSVLSKIREVYGTIIINISMDDRHQYWGRKLNGVWLGTHGLIPHLDLALTAASECVEWYIKENCPAIYFPEASDPNIFYPMPELPKIHDVCFVGGCYGIREKIVRAIQQASINVTAYGNGWPNGRIPTEEVPRLFAQSKIILGIGTIGHCHDFCSLKMRDFDGPMSGSLYLTQHNVDLVKFFEIDKEIVTYKNISDCISKVQGLLQDDKRRENIAKAGRLRAEQNHTWENRFKMLLRTLKNPIA